MKRMWVVGIGFVVVLTVVSSGCRRGWPVSYDRRCAENLIKMEFELEVVLSSSEAGREELFDSVAYGEDALIWMANHGFTDTGWLICPLDQRPDASKWRRASIKDITSASISYSTWKWSATNVDYLRTSLDTPLIWDKWPNHKGKRMVVMCAGPTKLMDENDFESVMQPVREHLKELERPPATPASVDKSGQ